MNKSWSGRSHKHQLTESLKQQLSTQKNEDIPKFSHKSQLNTREFVSGEICRLATRAQLNWNRNWYGSIGSIVYLAAKLLHIYNIPLQFHTERARTYKTPTQLDEQKLKHQQRVPYANINYNRTKPENIDRYMYRYAFKLTEAGYYIQHHAVAQYINEKITHG